MKLIGKLVCWARGHKRGKRVDAAVKFMDRVIPVGQIATACPRCGRVLFYNAKSRGIAE